MNIKVLIKMLVCIIETRFDEMCGSIKVVIEMMACNVETHCDVMAIFEVG